MSRCTSPAACAASRALSDLIEERQGARGIELAGAQEIRQRRPVDEPHRQEEAIRRVAADLVDVQHVWVLERRLQPALAAEPVDEVGILSEFGPQDLQRDAAMERSLDRLVDDAHAAAPEDALDGVALEPHSRLITNFQSSPLPITRAR